MGVVERHNRHCGDDLVFACDEYVTRDFRRIMAQTFGLASKLCVQLPPFDTAFDGHTYSDGIGPTRQVLETIDILLS